jgi:glycosyltransferase involved in cell wall biosynthesis
VKRGKDEREVLESGKYFIGRTDWDAAHLTALNPKATYFHGEELLRAEFYQHCWNERRFRPYSIYCSAAHSPLKGFHVLLEALSLLRGEFPEVTVRVAGAPWDAQSGFGYYGRYLKRLIGDLGLSRSVIPLPALSAGQVAAELATSAAFVIPSLIENSPNSLAEAMLVGTPCVAALVGGIPSMIDDGRNALGFPSGDGPCLAHALHRLFQEPTLGEKLSREARITASARQGKDAIVANQLRIYERILAAEARPS